MRYTPEIIAQSRTFYTIPIYQRLFEWNIENVETLLGDLKKGFDQSQGKEDYYIGMLTSTRDNELVDGQQRFTVMMLLGCVMQKYHEPWKSFLTCEDRLRIGFSSRPMDNIYLKSLVEDNEAANVSFKNVKMHLGYETIAAFMEKYHDEEERKKFAEYVYCHLTFFVSELPEGYAPADLNKYFERMNTMGKNLEQHDILKVKMLSRLGAECERYMMLWNRLADVHTYLIRERKQDNIKERKRRALGSDIATIFSENLINGLTADDISDSVRIEDIQPSATPPKPDREVSVESRSTMTFPYLLLQVLYRKLGDPSVNITEFFNPNNLLDVFEKYLPYNGNNANADEIKDFMKRLVKARLALDICFIRPAEDGYFLDMNTDQQDESLNRLKMLQSMYYVSSSNYTNYRWFNWLMDEIEAHDGIPDIDEMYFSLKEHIDTQFSLPGYDGLSYGGDNRFWFWKLDFFIWENRKEIFADNPIGLSIAEKYIFRRNRSIEHIAPQTPQDHSDMIWDGTDEDIALCNNFGNLAMISQGLNSSLSNESYEIKMAHVKSYCNGSKSGSIESLKMLVAHMDYPDRWDRETIQKHGEKMYDWLKKCSR